MEEGEGEPSPYTPPTYNPRLSSVKTSHPSSVIAIVSLIPTPNLRGTLNMIGKWKVMPGSKTVSFPLRYERRPIGPGRREPDPDAVPAYPHEPHLVLHPLISLVRCQGHLVGRPTGLCILNHQI